MAEVVEVVVDMVVEAQKVARSRPNSRLISGSRPTSRLIPGSRPTSRLIPEETLADGTRTNGPLSMKAGTDEPLPATVLINTQTHDSRTPRQTSSWVVLSEEETREESGEPNETQEETVSANQAVIEATKSLVSSLFPWAVDMVLKNENIKETIESTSTNENNEKEDPLVDVGAVKKNDESSENDEFDEALGNLRK